LRQPWAWACVYGPKWIENRVWFRELAGPLWLASTVRTARPYYRAAREHLLRLAGEALEVPHFDDLTHGAVLGCARVTDYILPGGFWSSSRRVCSSAATLYKLSGKRWGENTIDAAPHPLRGQRWHFPDQYGYVLADRRPLERPVPCSGRQQSWTMPRELVELVDRVPLLAATPPRLESLLRVVT
jgi:hypothetical protein